MTEPQASGARLALPDKIEHFIGGRLVPSVSGGTFDVADPVSNRVYARAAAGDADDVGKAVDAAAAAFDGPWPGLAARARAKILNAVADGDDLQPIDGPVLSRRRLCLCSGDGHHARRIRVPVVGGQPVLPVVDVIAEHLRRVLEGEREAADDSALDVGELGSGDGPIAKVAG